MGGCQSHSHNKIAAAPASGFDGWFVWMQTGETIRRNFREDSARDNRDAVAKAVFQRLFSWLVSSCNDILIDPEISRYVAACIGVLGPLQNL